MGKNAMNGKAFRDGVEEKTVQQRKPAGRGQATQLTSMIVGAILSGIFLIGAMVALLLAQSYPTKPIRLIIPFPPGGSLDFVGRAVAIQLSERLWTQVVVDNRGGAGGLLGVEAAAHSQPDGYTLLLISAAYPIFSSTHSHLPYDPVKSFAPVAKLGTAPNVLAVFPGLPVKSVKELIALAKEKPGKLICASTGAGGYQHLAGELFFMMADIDVKTVQFKGGAPATIDTIGGHSQIQFGSLTTAMPYIKSGKLRALGVGGLKRNAMLPDVPTISEAGVPGYESSTWYGILAPAATPEAIVARLNKEIRTILASAETQKQFLTQGAEADYSGPAEFGKFIESETVKWAKVVRKANIKPL